MEIDPEESVDITTTRADDVGMEDAPANNEKEKKKKKKRNKKKSKKKKARDATAVRRRDIIYLVCRAVPRMPSIHPS